MIFIIVYGRSGSGKTTIAKELSSFLSKQFITSSIVSLDYFYKESYDGSFDQPDAFHWDRLQFIVKQLISNKTVYLQRYQYDTKLYDTTSSFPIYPCEVCIIEGILANYCYFLQNKHTITIKINTPPDVCLARRILRDKKERNISPQDNIHRWLQDVRVMWNRWQEDLIATQDTLEPQFELSGNSNIKLERLSVYEILNTIIQRNEN